MGGRRSADPLAENRFVFRRVRRFPEMAPVIVAGFATSMMVPVDFVEYPAPPAAAAGR
jgi:hypothetical protein